MIAAASIADFGAIILLSQFFSGKGSTSTAATLVLLGCSDVLGCSDASSSWSAWRSPALSTR